VGNAHDLAGWAIGLVWQTIAICIRADIGKVTACKHEGIHGRIVCRRHTVLKPRRDKREGDNSEKRRLPKESEHRLHSASCLPQFFALGNSVYRKALIAHMGLMGRRSRPNVTSPAFT
jgi:hypothetical protein